MSTVIDNVLDCLTVELNINNKVNISISSWYSKPGSSIDIWRVFLEILFRRNGSIRYSFYMHPVSAHCYFSMTGHQPI